MGPVHDRTTDPGWLRAIMVQVAEEAGTPQSLQPPRGVSTEDGLLSPPAVTGVAVASVSSHTGVASEVVLMGAARSTGSSSAGADRPLSVVRATASLRRRRNGRPTTPGHAERRAFLIPRSKNIVRVELRRPS